MSLPTPESIILVYGQGGLGKSTLLAQLAAHVWKTKKKHTRIVGADGGGVKPFKMLIDEGIVHYWPIDLWDEKSIFSTLDLATKGWWPEDVNYPNSPLLAPYRDWKACPHCGGDTGAVGHASPTKCAACGKAIPPGARLDRQIEYLNGMDQVGAVCFEGATAFGNLLLSRLRTIDPSGGHQIKDGNFTIAQLGQQHYGNAQTYLQQYIANTRTLPVEMVVWTALELRGTDDGGKPIFGPAMPGKKLTTLCIPWFTDVIHLDGVAEGRDTLTGVDKVKRQLFLAPHYPTDTKPFGFAAKTSAPPGGGMPAVLDATDGKNVMSEYMNLLAAAYEKSKKALLS